MLKTIVGIVLLTATPVVAQQNCGDASAIHSRLMEQYHEAPRTMGMANGSAIVQYANEETGTWTILVLNPNGIACLVASGDSWQSMEAQPTGDPA